MIGDWFMADIILYNKPECPFCWKVRIALNEIGLYANLVDSNAPETRLVWESLNPKKTVPVFVHNEVIIYESNVILEYLSDITGELIPSIARDRVFPRLINSYSDTVIGVGLKEVIFEKRSKDEGSWDLNRIQAGTKTFWESLLYLENALGDGDFFAEEYSIAECALTARFGLAEAYGVAIPDQFPKLRNWYSRMKKRPSFRATAPEHLLFERTN